MHFTEGASIGTRSLFSVQNAKKAYLESKAIIDARITASNGIVTLDDKRLFANAKQRLYHHVALAEKEKAAAKAAEDAHFRDVAAKEQVAEEEARRLAPDPQTTFNVFALQRRAQLQTRVFLCCRDFPTP